MALLILTARYFYLKKKYRAKPVLSRSKSILLVVLFAYIGMLAATTLAGRYSMYARYANFHLFRAWRDAWNNFSQQSWLNVLINIAMFMPLGFILPFLAKKFRRWFWPLVSGLVLSSAIEAVQYFTGIGLFDVDDIFCNTLGAFLGGSAALAILALSEGDSAKWRKFSAFISIPLIFVLSVSGVFAAYHFKEYGNIPEAPGYRQYTKNSEWILNCELSSESGRSAVFKSPGMTRKSADSFAAEFGEAHSFEITVADYSDYSAEYRDENTGSSLYINFPDGTYIYEKEQDTPGFTQTDFSESEVLDALKEFGAAVPSGASFSRDKYGTYIFEAEMLPAPGGMYLGTVSCDLSERCEIEKLYMFMVKATECGEEAVISEQKAYERLVRGDFSGPEWFPGEEPESFEITDCSLEYRPDSKGFYRPVYIFEGLADGYPLGYGLLVLAD
ncbi:MAG: VanZ family protein [Candidatus Limivicinus sp.]